MTLDRLLKLLRCHLAALQSTAWPRPHGPSNGPAIYLDAADTSALITELAGIQRKLETAGLGGDALGRAESGAAKSVENIAKDLVAGKTTKARRRRPRRAWTNSYRNSARTRPSALEQPRHNSSDC